MSFEYKGTATVERLKNGQYFLKFSGDVARLIKHLVIKKYGKSTKRINKKRFKQYLKTVIIDSSELIVMENKNGSV